MPACQQIMSVTVSGPFTIGPTSSPSSTSSHQRGSAPRARSRLVLRLDLVDLLVGVRPRARRASYFLRLARLLALGADHQPVLARQHRAGLVAEHLRGPLVHRPARELARLVERGHERVAAEHPAQRVQRRPPLARARRVERVHAAQRVALHQVAVLGRDLGDLVLADERVAADERRRRDRPPPTASSAP